MTPSLFDLPPDTVSSPVYKTPKKTRTARTSKKSEDGDRMAGMFRMYPNRRVSALFLERGYGLRWRTTVSDLRFPPYHMDIQWKPEPYVNAKGKRKLKSFYVYVPSERGE